MKLPLNPAVKVGDTVYLGGIPPVDENNQIVEKGNMGAQVRRIFERMEGFLSKAGMGLKNLVFVTVYLSDIKMYREMNEVYGELMPEPYPARKVIQAPMTLNGMLVEISGIASAGEKQVL